jgi:hypothetical protein
MPGGREPGSGGGGLARPTVSPATRQTSHLPNSLRHAHVTRSCWRRAAAAPAGCTVARLVRRWGVRAKTAGRCLSLCEVLASDYALARLPLPSLGFVRNHATVYSPNSPVDRANLPDRLHGCRVVGGGGKRGADITGMAAPPPLRGPRTPPCTAPAHHGKWCSYGEKWESASGRSRSRRPSTVAWCGTPRQWQPCAPAIEIVS